MGDVIVIRGELPPRREIANPEAQIKDNNIEQFLSQEHIQINSVVAFMLVLVARLRRRLQRPQFKDYISQSVAKPKSEAR